MQPKMTISEMQAFLAEIFPQVRGKFEVLALEPMKASVRMNIDKTDLRPGGTVSGPSMFALADVAFYIATLAMIGPQALTVTTNCTINFMRKPEPVNLLAEARILKLGRSLCVGDVTLFSEGFDNTIAHASLTYSIPPNTGV